MFVCTVCGTAKNYLQDRGNPGYFRASRLPFTVNSYLNLENGRMHLLAAIRRAVSLDKLHRYRRRNNSRSMCFLQQSSDGFTAARPIIQRPVIDVHADETIGQALVHVPRIAKGISQGVIAMV